LLSLVAVGHDQYGHLAGPLVLGKDGQVGAHLGDEPAERVQQRGRAARLEFE
jgi:hypothetical protein